MTESIGLEFHEQAQPVRSAAGFLLACYPPASSTRFTLLVDLAATEQSPAWNLMPDRAHRLLLMLDSPRLIRLDMELRRKAEWTLTVKGRVSRIVFLRSEHIAADGRSGFRYHIHMEHDTSATTLQTPNEEPHCAI
ncbi:MAG TPA: hypothetical protein PK760_00560 [Flavobacteriales bacterium]|nr:hypothetical protein [Flavobacteriales bacterium]